MSLVFRHRLSDLDDAFFFKSQKDGKELYLESAREILKYQVVSDVDLFQSDYELAFIDIDGSIYKANFLVIHENLNKEVKKKTKLDLSYFDVGFVRVSIRKKKDLSIQYSSLNRAQLRVIEGLNELLEIYSPNDGVVNWERVTNNREKLDEGSGFSSLRRNLITSKVAKIEENYIKALDLVEKLHRAQVDNQERLEYLWNSNYRKFLPENHEVTIDEAASKAKDDGIKGYIDKNGSLLIIDKIEEHHNLDYNVIKAVRLNNIEDYPNILGKTFFDFGWIRFYLNKYELGISFYTVNSSQYKTIRDLYELASLYSKKGKEYELRWEFITNPEESPLSSGNNLFSLRSRVGKSKEDIKEILKEKQLIPRKFKTFHELDKIQKEMEEEDEQTIMNEFGSRIDFERRQLKEDEYLERRSSENDWYDEWLESLKEGSSKEKLLQILNDQPESLKNKYSMNLIEKLHKSQVDNRERLEDLWNSNYRKFLPEKSEISVNEAANRSKTREVRGYIDVNGVILVTNEEHHNLDFKIIKVVRENYPKDYPSMVGKTFFDFGWIRFFLNKYELGLSFFTINSLQYKTIKDMYELSSLYNKKGIYYELNWEFLYETDQEALSEGNNLSSLRSRVGREKEDFSGIPEEKQPSPLWEVWSFDDLNEIQLRMEDEKHKQRMNEFGSGLDTHRFNKKEQNYLKNKDEENEWYEKWIQALREGASKEGLLRLLDEQPESLKNKYSMNLIDKLHTSQVYEKEAIWPFTQDLENLKDNKDHVLVQRKDEISGNKIGRPFWVEYGRENGSKSGFWVSGEGNQGRFLPYSRYEILRKQKPGIYEGPFGDEFDKLYEKSYNKVVDTVDKVKHNYKVKQQANNFKYDLSKPFPIEKIRVGTRLLAINSRNTKQYIVTVIDMNEEGLHVKNSSDGKVFFFRFDDYKFFSPLKKDKTLREGRELSRIEKEGLFQKLIGKTLQFTNPLNNEDYFIGVVDFYNAKTDLFQVRSKLQTRHIPVTWIRSKPEALTYKPVDKTTAVGNGDKIVEKSGKYGFIIRSTWSDGFAVDVFTKNKDRRTTFVSLEWLTNNRDSLMIKKSDRKDIPSSITRTQMYQFLTKPREVMQRGNQSLSRTLNPNLPASPFGVPPPPATDFTRIARPPERNVPPPPNVNKPSQQPNKKRRQ